VISRLKLLVKQLKKLGLSNDALKIKRIIKICSMPGIDYPTEEIDVEGIDSVLEYLDENPGKFIFLDNPKGSKKRFGQKLRKKMPFHYGEFTEVNNPADDMGWDVIIVPSAKTTTDPEDEEEDVKHIPQGHSLIAVGYVPVNDSDEEWREKTKSPSRPEGKPAPKGNDKIVLAPDGVVTDDDKKKIEKFFKPMWNFKDVIWL